MNSGNNGKNSAKYFAKILENPTELAVSLFKIFSAYVSAGFTNEQAMELTKNTMALIIGVGGLAE